MKNNGYAEYGISESQKIPYRDGGGFIKVQY